MGECLDVVGTVGQIVVDSIHGERRARGAFQEMVLRAQAKFFKLSERKFKPLFSHPCTCTKIVVQIVDWMSFPPQAFSTFVALVPMRGLGFAAEGCVAQMLRFSLGSFVGARHEHS